MAHLAAAWGHGRVACGGPGRMDGLPMGFWVMDGLPVGVLGDGRVACGGPGCMDGLPMGSWDMWRTSHADTAVPLGWSSHSVGPMRIQ